MYKQISLAVALLLGLVQATDHWAVIVAGSNGFWNYRHQADACHAYQIMKKNGIPESNIVTMLYDDVASDPENPFPGKLFNKPNGEDVYAGCNIDYKGNDVTPENFLNILQGQATKGGNGKVLKSTADSKVFIYFADHGAPGLIAFPNEYLYANDLNKALLTMHDKKMYSELVFYLEACESGSMFENILKNDIGIYAITAANADESSWGTYCYPDDIVNGVHINSCLGDLFSVNWMEDTDAQNIHQESLATQFDKVQKLTAQSHVMKYGQQSFTNEPIGNFQGNFNDAAISPKKAANFFERVLKTAKKQLTDAPLVDTKKHISAVHSRDAKMHHLYSTLQTKPGHKITIDLSTELNARMRTDHTFEDLVDEDEIRNSSLLPRDFNCLKEAVNTYEKHCGKLSDYDLRYVRHLVYICETAPSHIATETAIAKIQEACSH